MFMDCSLADRLIDIKENQKFRKEGRSGDTDGPAMGFHDIVTEIKDQFSLKYMISFSFLFEIFAPPQTSLISKSCLCYAGMFISGTL